MNSAEKFWALAACLAAFFAFGLQAVAQLPHLDDLSKQGEHLALLKGATGIVPEFESTAVAVRSGDWSDPATWNVPPGEGARVLIPRGFVVTVDADIAPRIEWVRVNGVLQFFQETDTVLRVGTIVVDVTGTLKMGISEDPFEAIQASSSAKIIFADFGEIDRDRDPRGLSRGLISHGTVRIHGAETTPYAFVSAPATKGSTQLELTGIPTNWKVGGRVVLPSVIYLYANAGDGLSVDDDEEMTITELEPSPATGTTRVTLNRPLKYDHLPPAGIRVPLAYLDRNVIFISENPAISRRGHVMLMHSADAEVSDALFEQLGRTDASVLVTDPQLDAQGRLIPETTGNDRGRYSLHVHRTIPDPGRPVTIRRVCVINSPKFGVVNHDSNVICEDSVVFDAAGSGFFTEVGSEIGAFRRNLAIHSVRGGGYRGEVERFLGDVLPEGTDFGSNGNGFWFQGAGIEVTDNMSFKCKDIGFVYATLAITTSQGEVRFLRSNLTPENPFYDPNRTGATVAVSQVPIKRFSGNIAVASYTGFMLRKHDPIGLPSIMENSIVANASSFGIDAEYGGPKIFRNLLIHGGTGAPDGYEKYLQGLGDWGFVCNENSNNITIENCEFRNFINGIRLTVTQTNQIKDTVIDSIRNLVIENGPSTSQPTTIERVTFAHTVPLLQLAPYDHYEDIEMKRAHLPVAPVYIFGGEPDAPPGPSAPAPAPIDLYWGAESSSVFYPITTLQRSALLGDKALKYRDGDENEEEVGLPLTLASAGQAGTGVAATYRMILTFDKFLSTADISISAGTASIVGEPAINDNRVTFDIAGLTSNEAVVLTATTTTVDELTATVNIPLTITTVSITATSPTTTEGSTTPGAFTIYRSGAIDAPLTVEYSVGGTATNGDDYRHLSGTVTFEASETSVVIPVIPTPDTLVEGTENVKLSVNYGQGYLLSLIATATVDIEDPAHQSWRATIFGADANNPAIGTDDADPDHDLRSNFMEFALASNPLSSAPDPLPAVMLEGGNLTLTYRRPVAAGDLRYLIQETASLLNEWTPAEATDEILFDDDNTRVIKAIVPINGAPAKLIRLRISRP